MSYLYDDHFAELQFIILPRKCIHCNNRFFLTNVYIKVYTGEAICVQCGQQKYSTEPVDPVENYKSKEPELKRQIKELIEEKKRREAMKS